jgi:hypothetical protein
MLGCAVLPDDQHWRAPRTTLLPQGANTWLPLPSTIDEVDSASLLKALKAFQRGDFSVRLPMALAGQHRRGTEEIGSGVDPARGPPEVGVETVERPSGPRRPRKLRAQSRVVIDLHTPVVPAVVSKAANSTEKSRRTVAFSWDRPSHLQELGSTSPVPAVGKNRLSSRFDPVSQDEMPNDRRHAGTKQCGRIGFLAVRGTPV